MPSSRSALSPLLRPAAVASSAWLAVAACEGRPVGVEPVSTSSSALDGVQYCDFGSVAGLQLNGSAAQAGNALELTPDMLDLSGSVFLTSPLALGGSTDFHTHFRFALTPGANGHADGVAFVVQADTRGPKALGGFGGALGYGAAGGLPITPSVVVEFDTFLNAGDPSDNHVAVMLDGDETGHVASANPAFQLSGGGAVDAWIDYAAATTTLQVFVSNTGVKPGAPLLSTSAVDVSSTVGGAAYFGFTAATGGFAQTQAITMWALSLQGLADCGGDAGSGGDDGGGDDASSETGGGSSSGSSSGGTGSSSGGTGSSSGGTGSSSGGTGSSSGGTGSSSGGTGSSSGGTGSSSGGTGSSSGGTGSSSGGTGSSSGGTGSSSGGTGSSSGGTGSSSGGTGSSSGGTGSSSGGTGSSSGGTGSSSGGTGSSSGGTGSSSGGTGSSSGGTGSSSGGTGSSSGGTGSSSGAAGSSSGAAGSSSGGTGSSSGGSSSGVATGSSSGAPPADAASNADTGYMGGGGPGCSLVPGSADADADGAFVALAAAAALAFGRLRRSTGDGSGRRR
nr:hypothetical protein Hi04_10k_c2441A_00011 [uncultured bacterium]